MSAIQETVKISFEMDNSGLKRGAQESVKALKDQERALRDQARALDLRVNKLRASGSSDQTFIRSLQSQSRELKLNAQALSSNAQAMQRSNQTLKQTSSTATAAAASFKGLALGVAGVASALGLVKIAKVADDYKLLQDRIKNVTRATGDYAKVSKDLSSVSKQTGSQLQDTVDVFQRVSIGARDLGKTNSEIIKVVKTVQQLGALGGTKGPQLSAGLLQFGQALSGQIVRAEEFNSVVENLPLLAQKIADGFGVSLGQLRQLVLDGKVLSKDVFDVLLKQTAAVQKEFEELSPSVQRSFQALKTTLTEFIGQLNETIDGTTSLAQAFDAVGVAIQKAQQPTIDFIKYLNELFVIYSSNLIPAFQETVKLLGEIAGGFKELGGGVQSVGEIFKNIVVIMTGQLDAFVTRLNQGLNDIKAFKEAGNSLIKGDLKGAGDALFENRLKRREKIDSDFKARGRIRDALLQGVPLFRNQGNRQNTRDPFTPPKGAPLIPVGGKKAKKTPSAPAFPIAGFDLNNAPITSGFRTKSRPDHNGIDFGVPVGTALRAPLSGVVTRIFTDKNGGGNVIEITSESLGNKIVNRFLHTSRATVSQGQRVSRDQQIGLSGNTGLSTGPHLHLRTLVNGDDVNPIDFLKGKYSQSNIEDTLAAAEREAKQKQEELKRADRESFDKILDNSNNLLNENEIKVTRATSALSRYADETQRAQVELEGLNEKLAILQETRTALEGEAKSSSLDKEDVEKVLVDNQKAIADTEAARDRVQESIAAAAEEVQRLKTEFNQAIQELDFQDQQATLETQIKQQSSALKSAYDEGKISANEYYAQLKSLSDQTFNQQIQQQQLIIQQLQSQLQARLALVESAGREADSDREVLALRTQIRQSQSSIVKLEQGKEQAQIEIQDQNQTEIDGFADNLASNVGNALSQAISAALSGGSAQDAIKNFGNALKSILINFVTQAIGQAINNALKGSFQRIAQNAAGQPGGLSGKGGAFGAGLSSLRGTGLGKLLGIVGILGAPLIGLSSGNPVSGALGGALSAGFGGLLLTGGNPIGAVLGGLFGAVTGGIGGLFGSKKKKKQERDAKMAEQTQREVNAILKTVNTRKLNYDELNAKAQQIQRMGKGRTGQSDAIINQAVEQLMDLMAERQQQLNDAWKQYNDKARKISEERQILAQENPIDKAKLQRQFELDDLSRETKELLNDYRDSQSVMTQILNRETEKRLLIEEKYKQTLKDNAKEVATDLDELLKKRDEISNRNVFQRAKSNEQIKAEDLAAVDKDIAKALKDLDILSQSGAILPKDIAGINFLVQAARRGVSTFNNELNIIIEGAKDPNAVAEEVRRQLELFWRKQFGASLS